jgi:hypothetical protein
MSQIACLVKDVIEVVKNVKDVISSVPDEKEENIKLSTSTGSETRVAILCSKTLNDKDLSTLKEMGKTYVFRDTDVHTNLNDIDFDYIIFDMKNAIHSRYVMNNDTTNILQVAYVYFYEKQQAWIEDFKCSRAMCHLPESQANKSMFNNLMRAKSYHVPERTLITVLKFIKKSLLGL